MTDGRSSAPAGGPTAPTIYRRRIRWIATISLVTVVGILPACGSASGGSTASSSASTGTPAPNFALVDQWGQPQTMAGFEGKTVLLTFIDSRCTTVCPLTAQLMRETEQSLGPDHPVQLLAIDANPHFRAVADVRRWSARHRMLHRWLFLTGTLRQLRSVWRAYGIQVKMVDDDVEHTALVYVVDPAGSVQAPFPIAQHRSINEEAGSLARFVQQIAPSH
jgi:cytochrome oxidase Cu insertion factor (SCO1/SenC/PrrC family)